MTSTPAFKSDRAWRPSRVVLVAVGGYDLRSAAALRHAVRLGASTVRAVHVCADEDQATDLGGAWMDAHVQVPLEIVEGEGGVAPTIARCVRDELEHGADEVVVLTGRMHRARHRWLSHLLHDRTADAIAAHVTEIPRARAVVVDVVLAPAAATDADNIANRSFEE